MSHIGEFSHSSAGSAVHAQSPNTRRVILLVDDEPQVGKLVTAVCRRFGIDVEHVLTAAEGASAVLGETHFELALIDLILDHRQANVHPI